MISAVPPAVRRPDLGFERLVAWLCAGEVGASCSFDVPTMPATVAIGITCSSSAGLVEARVIDLDGP